MSFRFDRFDPEAEELEDYLLLVDKLKKRLPEIFNVRGQDRSVSLENVTIDLPDDVRDYRKQQQVKDKNGTYAVPVKGDFIFRDASGRVRKRIPGATIANMPLPTGRGTFIVDGHEYSIRKQLRLKPGVYVTHQKDGVQAFVNTSTRQNMKISLDPEGIMQLTVGTKSFPIYPVLSALGISDSEMRNAWGQRIFDKNATGNTQKVVDRLHATMYMYGGKAKDYAGKVDEIARAMTESDIDPWTSKITLGRSYHSISPELLLQTSGKMLDVSSGKVKPDRRDALYFKQAHGFDDIIDYGLVKARPVIQRKLADRLNNPVYEDAEVIARPVEGIRGIVGKTFTQADLSFTPDQVNPIGMKSDANELTYMGEGGIGSDFSIAENTRKIDDSMMGFIDPVQTPTSYRVGVNMHMASTARKIHGDLAKAVWDLRSGEAKPAMLTAKDAYDQYVAIPGQFSVKNGRYVPKGRTVTVLHHGEFEDVPVSKVTHYLGNESGALSYGTLLIPFLGNDTPIRASMSVKQSTHALPLKNREVPLVQSVIGDEKDGSPITADNYFYKKLVRRVPSYIGKGEVVKVKPDEIWVKEDKTGETHKIQLYNNFVLNSESILSDVPVVKVGDRVAAGQPLAENNFTRDGNLAMGMNLKIAYVPYKGLNFMDGLVISESAAKKLAVERLYREEHSRRKNDVFSKKTFISHYPGLYSKEALEKLDDDGVIAPGTVVRKGDPLILKMSPRQLTEDDIIRGNVSTVFKNPLARDEKIWEHEVDGIVDRVVKEGGHIKVFVRTEEPAVRGDKLSNRHQAKGVIVSVIPDEEMPHFADGSIPDILQNPAAVPSRANLGQVLETGAAKIALKQGKTYLARAFSEDNSMSKVYNELKALGLEDTEQLYDPDGTPIGAPVLAGHQYFTRQKQQAEKYFQARNREDPYDIVSHRPIHGPKVGPLGFYALLAHGATDNLREIAGVKSELNDDFWRAVETNEPLPTPQNSFAFDKLQGMMRAAGINMRREGADYRLIPLVDDDVASMSSGEVTDPGRAVRIGQPGRYDMLQPQPGGLYDRKIFGGLNGDKWGHITLASPMPNPVFENAIRAVTGLTQDQFKGLVSGEYALNNGMVVENDGSAGLVTGAEAFRSMLKGIDPRKDLKAIKEQIPTAKGTTRDALVKKARYLNGLMKSGLSAEQAYLLSAVPVLPPMFRPVYLGDKGQIRISDLTMLYQDLGRVNQTLQEADKKGVPSQLTRTLRADLYDAMKAVQATGTGQEAGGKPRLGALSYLKGINSPTGGHFQDKIFSKRQSIGGRAVIMANPGLSVDEVGIPEDMAWTIYKSFVMRRLTGQGLTALEAKKAIETRTGPASDALNLEMKERPVLLTRDPRLHKFNHMAFWPRRIPGYAIEMPPLVVIGFNADFDGDAMGVSVPVTAEAVKEARTKMFPSQNLFKAGRDTIIMKPEEENIAGLYMATRVLNPTEKRYKNASDVIRDYRAGDLKVHDGIHLNGKLTTPGRVVINEVLPEDLRSDDMVLNNRGITSLLEQVARKHPNSYTKVLERLKDLGDHFAYREGMSFSMKDFVELDTPELEGLQPGQPLTDKQRDAIRARLKKSVPPNSALALLAESGAKGSWDKIQDLLYSPIAFTDVGGGEVVPRVIRRGFSKGLDWQDYWAASKGARHGLFASSVEVRDPGYFSKQLMRSTLGMTVIPGDSKDHEGISYPVSHPTVLNRYLAEDIVIRGRKLGEAGDPVTAEMVNAAKKAGVNTIMVRSPLTTMAEQGLYARDFGRLPGNITPQVGTDLGVISGHTLTEPAVQLALRSRHGAGTVDRRGLTGLYAIWPILNGMAPPGHKAALSPFDGTITKTERTRAGNYIVTLDNGEMITTPPTDELWVSKGQKIKRGQQLHEGYPDPKEVLEMRGLRDLQMYLVDELEKNFDNLASDRRYLETVVSGLTRYGVVEDPGERDDLMPGDIVNSNSIMKYNKNLKAMQRPVNFKPLFVGMDMALPTAESDWAVKMLGRDMIRQIEEAAALGLTSSTQNPKPIMPYVYGLDFGRRLSRSGEY